MAIKYFCDKCKNEIPNKLVNVAMTALVLDIECRIMLIHPAPTVIKDQRHICKYCIIDSFNKLDDRPVAENIDPIIHNRLIRERHTLVLQLKYLLENTNSIVGGKMSPDADVWETAHKAYIDITGCNLS